MEPVETLYAKALTQIVTSSVELMEVLRCVRGLGIGIGSWCVGALVRWCRCCQESGLGQVAWPQGRPQFGY